MPGLTDAPTAFSQPETLEEAVALKASSGIDAMFVGGGTDLGVMLRRRLATPRQIISLSRIPELRRLEVADGEVTIGASVTHRQVERSVLYQGADVALRDACRTVGSIQTRNVGTIGGNLANASPAADTPPVLLALDASVELAGPSGRRRVPLHEFFIGYRRTQLAPDELLLAVHHRPAPERAGSAFIKLGRRRAMEISISCAGVSVALDPDGNCATVGIGIGSMAPTSLRAAAAEHVLTGRRPDPDVVAEAAHLAAQACQPIDDVRASAAYRRAVVVPLVRRCLELAVERARDGHAGQGAANG